MLDLFSELFIRNVRFVFNQFYYLSSPTPAYNLFVLLFLILVIYSLFRLWQKYNIVQGIKRAQLKYILIALFIGFAGGSFSF